MRFITAILILCICSTAAFAEDLVRRVNVTGTSEVRVEADMARVYLSAQSLQPTSAEAKREVDNTVNRVIALLDEVGLDTQNLTAGQISVSPRYEYRNNRQEFSGYFARRSIRVEIPALDRLNPFLDAALEQRIDGLERIEYRTSREFELKQQARDLAILDSQQQGASLAQAYGAQLGPIISVDYYNSNAVRVTYGAQPEMSLMRAAADGGGQFVPDQISFNDQISVTFELIVD